MAPRLYGLSRIGGPCSQHPSQRLTHSHAPQQRGQNAHLRADLVSTALHSLNSHSQSPPKHAPQWRATSPHSAPAHKKQKNSTQTPQGACTVEHRPHPSCAPQNSSKTQQWPDHLAPQNSAPVQDQEQQQARKRPHTAHQRRRRRHQTFPRAQECQHSCAEARAPKEAPRQSTTTQAPEAQPQGTLLWCVGPSGTPAPKTAAHPR